MKTPYGQKHGGGIWRRIGGKLSGARAPPKGRAKRRPPRRFPTSLRTFTLYHFPRPAYTQPRRFFCSPFSPQAVRQKQRTRLHPCAAAKAPRRAPVCGRLLEKTSAAKAPRPNSWTEASAPAAPRRRTERSESAAERARKAPPPHRQPPHFHPAPPPAAAPLSAPGVHPAAPFFVHRFCAPPGAKRRVRPAAPLRGGKSPRAAPRFCGRLLEKNKRGKNPAPE